MSDEYRVSSPGGAKSYILSLRLRTYKLAGRWLLSLRCVQVQLSGRDTGKASQYGHPSSPLVLWCWFWALKWSPLVPLWQELTIRSHWQLISKHSMFTDWELKINFAIRIPRNVFSDVFELFCLAGKKKKQTKKQNQRHSQMAAAVTCPRPVWASLGCVLRPMNKITWCRNSGGADWRLHSLSGEARWNNSPGLPFPRRLCAIMLKWLVAAPDFKRPALTPSPSLQCLFHCFLRWFSPHLEHTFVLSSPQPLINQVWLWKEKMQLGGFDASFLVGVSKCGMFGAKY